MFFFDPKTETRIRDTFTIKTEWTLVHDPKLLQGYSEGEPQEVSCAGRTIRMPGKYVFSINKPNRNYYHKIAEAINRLQAPA
jgi:hypothetical protein